MSLSEAGDTGQSPALDDDDEQEHLICVRRGYEVLPVFTAAIEGGADDVSVNNAECAALQSN
jgi:hypothetical protein